MPELMTPDQIKTLMREGGDVNWLAVTALALYAEIERLEARIDDLNSNDE